MACARPHMANTVRRPYELPFPGRRTARFFLNGKVASKKVLAVPQNFRSIQSPHGRHKAATFGRGDRSAIHNDRDVHPNVAVGRQ
jgi:hypothetical protein